ncbi:hypothetical protein [Sphingobacterium sp. IITKGP-BTPF85]|uniref:hypothetical protein n=1 Tax=Sphingobacterium sp. IITKGP-BTPF85 TaxID=1338009 RepID=UPI00042704E7|nr:hypothetical protein [Sphingobacterium sp. IITKGP-BTPF85]
MMNIDRKIITKNILKLIDSNGINDTDFANLIDKSTRTLARIRKEKALFNIEDINIASSFFNKTLIEFNSPEIAIEGNSRNILKQIHKDNVAYYSLLEKRPSITYAITFYLLKNEQFCSAGMIVEKIKNFFESFGWYYSSSYISSAMVRNSEYVSVSGTEIIDGNKVNVYKAKI